MFKDQQLSHNSLFKFDNEGFGTLSSGGPEATQLRHVELAYVPRADCNSANAYNGAITDYMMCAADPNQNSCLGDSGKIFIILLLSICLSSSL